MSEQPPKKSSRANEENVGESTLENEDECILMLFPETSDRTPEGAIVDSSYQDDPSVSNTGLSEWDEGDTNIPYSRRETCVLALNINDNPATEAGASFNRIDMEDNLRRLVDEFESIQSAQASDNPKTEAGTSLSQRDIEDALRLVDDFESRPESAQAFGVAERNEIDINIPSSSRESPSVHNDCNSSLFAPNINENPEIDAGASLSLRDEEGSLGRADERASRLEPLEDENVASTPSPRGDNQDQEEEAVSILQHPNNSMEDQNHYLQPPEQGLPAGVSDTLSAMNHHPMNRFVPIAPKDPNSSDVASRPIKCPTNKKTVQKRGAGNGYSCPVCGRKTKDCDRRKCLLPLSGPGFFRAKTNGILYYFRRLEDLLSERTETRKDIQECTKETPGGKKRKRRTNCGKCLQLFGSQYHRTYCLYRRGLLQRLAADGRTMMIGFPIHLNPDGSIREIPEELATVLDDVLRDLRALQATEGQDITPDDQSQEDDSNDDGAKKPAAVDKKRPSKK